MSVLKKAMNLSPAYQAVKLGSKISQQHAEQKQQTKELGEQAPQSVTATPANPKIKKVSFGYSKYLGGHSTLGKKRQGNLVLSDTAIGIGTLHPKHAALQWSNIASVEVSGGQVGKSKVGATIVFGVLGGLAASGSKNQATIIVHTKDGQAAYYLIDKANPMEVRAKIAILLRAVGVPFGDDIAQQQSNNTQIQGSNLAEQLKQLAKLKEQGILTNEEFTAKKKQLLGL